MKRTMTNSPDLLLPNVGRMLIQCARLIERHVIKTFVLMLTCTLATCAFGEVIEFEGVAAPFEEVFMVAPYTEGNFQVAVSGQNNGIFSSSSGFNSAGFTTDYFAWDSFQAAPQVTISEIAGQPFNLDSLEIGQSATVGGPVTDVTLVGNLANGGTVSTTFFDVSTATVVAPIGFTNLINFEINAAVGNDAAIDNITLQVVPEPSSAVALVLLSFGCTFLRQRR